MQFMKPEMSITLESVVQLHKRCHRSKEGTVDVSKRVQVSIVQDIACNLFVEGQQS